MTQATNIMRGRERYYPCQACGSDHPSITTLLDVMNSRALNGWLSKNGTAKLNALKEHLEAVKTPSSLPILQAAYHNAERDWIAKEETAFWKSGKQMGQEAADYGTMAHAWIQAHFQGTEIGMEALPEPVQKSVNGFLQWEKEHKLTTIKTEQTFYHCELGFAGTCDWIGTVDGELTLMDWKTSSGIYANYLIQIWAYALADEFQHGDRLYRQGGIGRFGKDGYWEVQLYKRTDYPSIDIARDVMKACKVIFDFNRKYEEMHPYKPKEKK